MNRFGQKLTIYACIFKFTLNDALCPIQKLAGTKRNRGGRRPWFLQGLDIPDQDEIIEPLASMDEDADGDGKNLDELMPIELRQLESSEFADFIKMQEESNRNTTRSLLFSSLLYPRR